MTQKFQNAIHAVKPEGLLTKGLIPNDYGISFKDGVDLMRMANTGKTADAIMMAFVYGFAMGNRATHSRNIKRI